MKNDGSISTVQAEHKISFGNKSYSHVADLSTMPSNEIKTKDKGTYLPKVYPKTIENQFAQALSAMAGSKPTKKLKYGDCRKDKNCPRQHKIDQAKK